MSANGVVAAKPHWGRSTGAGLVALTVGLGLVLTGVPSGYADPLSPTTPIDMAANDGYVPWSFDTSSIDDGYSNNAGLQLTSSLPASYRVPPERVPAVRNQGSFNTCWAFASAESAESSLVRNGVFTTTSPDSQVSPSHLVQSVFYTGAFTSGAGNVYQQFGNSWLAATAWSHWHGAQSESAYTYPEDTTVIPAQFTANDLNASAYHLRDWYILPSPRNSKHVYTPANVTAIKQAVHSYGVATIGLAGWAIGYNGIPGMAPPVSTQYPSLYMPDWFGTGVVASTHAVAIIGWDDDYAIANFYSEYPPPGKGAFLVQNSYGDSFPYFWVSYYDYSLADPSIFNMGSSKPTAGYRSAYDWTTQYAYDDLGMNGWWTHDAGVKTTAKFANKYTAKAASTLRAAQVVTWDPNTKVTISVYLGPAKSTDPVSGASAAVLTTKGAKSVSKTLAYAGLQTITFPMPVILKKGQKFSIVVTEKSGSGAAKMPVEYYSTGIDGITSHLTISAGQSYYVNDSGKWQDLTSLYKAYNVTGEFGNANIIGLASPTPKYLVKYNANGGQVSSVSKSVTFKAKYGALAKPTRKGYKFLGWYTAKSGGKKVTSNTKMSSPSNKTVYAHWKKR